MLRTKVPWRECCFHVVKRVFYTAKPGLGWILCCVFVGTYLDVKVAVNQNETIACARKLTSLFCLIRHKYNS